MKTVTNTQVQCLMHTRANATSNPNNNFRYHTESQKVVAESPTSQSADTFMPLATKAACMRIASQAIQYNQVATQAPASHAGGNTK